MLRRGYLTAWGSAAATITGTVTSIERRFREKTRAVFQDDESVVVRIVETNAPVRAGGLLEVTIEVENAGATAVRAEIEQFFAGELRSTVRTSLHPGETKTLDTGTFRAPPVERDDTVSVRFETENDAAERSVDVLAVPDLDPARSSPDGELEVAPEASILFEVESEALGPYGGETRWFVDGEYDGQSLGPWYGAYYGHSGADHWQTSFESPGTYEVAAIVGEGDDTSRAAWTVRVTEDGTAGPTIEGRDPDEESLTVVRGEPIELALDVAHPDGGLDRVVWWLAHADVVVGESDVSGSEDTATLETDRYCYGCPIVTWVIDDNGAVTSEPGWTIEEVVDPEDAVDVTIVETNDPVDTGAVLEVTAELENATRADVTRNVDLIVGHNPVQVDSRSVTVERDATERITLEFETAVVRRTQEFPARVETADAADEVTVKVIGTEDIGLDVTIVETNTPVETGEFLEVTAELENAHGSALTRDVQLVVGHDPGVVETRLVTVDPGEFEKLAMGYETAIVERDQRFPVRVETVADADEESVFVYVDDPPLLVSIAETNDPVNAGEFLEVTAEVENPTDSRIARTVECIVGHDPQLVDAEFVRLDGGESESIALGYETAIVSNTQTFPVRVQSDGDTAERDVTVIGTEAEDAEPTAELLVSDQAGDGETLFVDEASANVDFTLGAGYDGRTVETDAFDAEERLSEFEIALDPPLEDDADVEVSVREAETDDQLAGETIAYAVDRQEPAFEISGVATAESVPAGESIEVAAEIENAGGETGETDVRLDIDGREVDGESISLAAGETGTVTLMYRTTAADAGDVSVTVRTADASEEVTVSVTEPDDSIDSDENSSDSDADEDGSDGAGDDFGGGDSGAGDSDGDDTNGDGSGGDTDGVDSDNDDMGGGDSDDDTGGGGADGDGSGSGNTGGNGSDGDDSVQDDSAGSAGSDSGSNGSDGDSSGGDGSDSGTSAADGSDSNDSASDSATGD